MPKEPMLKIAPPPTSSAPIVHKVADFYKLIYLASAKIPKKDRFGIFQKIESNCLELLDTLIEASLESKPQKVPLLNKARIMIEALKQLVRLASDLEVIDIKKYLALQSELQEISKMTNGWIKYLQ